MVRCADCGFLCRRDRETRELISLELESRNTGQLEKTDPSRSKSQASWVNTVEGLDPLCLVMAADLKSETRSCGSTKEPLQKERECESFIQWHQGFTPKEHKTMMFDMQAKKFEIEHRGKERKEDQDRHDRLMSEERERAEKVLRQQNKFAITLAVVSGIAGVISGVLSTVAGSILAKYLEK